MHNPHFALDIDIFVLHTELSPDKNHDGCFFFFLFVSFTRRGATSRCPGVLVLKPLRFVELLAV